MDELKNNPQIIELLETLEENGMHMKYALNRNIMRYSKMSMA